MRHWNDTKCDDNNENNNNDYQVKHRLIPQAERQQSTSRGIVCHVNGDFPPFPPTCTRPSLMHKIRRGSMRTVDFSLTCHLHRSVNSEPENCSFVATISVSFSAVIGPPQLPPVAPVEGHTGVGEWLQHAAVIGHSRCFARCDLIPAPKPRFCWQLASSQRELPPTQSPTSTIVHRSGLVVSALAKATSTNTQLRLERSVVL